MTEELGLTEREFSEFREAIRLAADACAVDDLLQHLVVSLSHWVTTNPNRSDEAKSLSGVAAFAATVLAASLPTLGDAGLAVWCQVVRQMAQEIAGRESGDAERRSA